MTTVETVRNGSGPLTPGAGRLPVWAAAGVRITALVGIPASGIAFVGTLAAAGNNTGFAALGCLAMAPIATAWALVFARLFSLDPAAVRVAGVGNLLALVWAIVVLAARPLLPYAAVWLTAILFPPALLPFGVEFVMSPVPLTRVDEAMAGSLALSATLLFVTSLLLTYAAWSGSETTRTPHDAIA